MIVTKILIMSLVQDFKLGLCGLKVIALFYNQLWLLNSICNSQVRILDTVLVSLLCQLTEKLDFPHSSKHYHGEGLVFLN